MPTRSSLALVLLAVVATGCTRTTTGRAATLYDPIEVPDVLGFVWAASLEPLKDVLAAAPGGEGLAPDLPLLPDPTVLGIVGKDGVDPAHPVALILVDPQVYGASVAYVLGITGEEPFLASWRALDGMQEVPDDARHFFANRRTLKLTTGLTGLPQAEVRRRDYYVRFADGLALVLPSRDAEGSVKRVVERFQLTGRASKDVSEFVSLDLGRVVQAHGDSLQMLKDMLARLDSDTASLMSLGRDAGQWLFDRLHDLDRFHFARAPTMFSARLSVKPGSKLRDDLGIFAGPIRDPFNRLPQGCPSALDLAVDPVHLDRLTRWLSTAFPTARAGEASAKAGTAKRFEGTRQGESMLVLVQGESERAIASFTHTLVPEVSFDSLSTPVPVPIASLIPSLPRLSELKENPWLAAQGEWCGVLFGKDAALLARAVKGEGPLGGPDLGGWPKALLANASVLWHLSPGDSFPGYAIRLAIAGDELLVDGQELVRP